MAVSSIVGASAAAKTRRTLETMLRTALKPRWLGWLAALIVVVVAFIWLGLWQFGVAHTKGDHDAMADEANKTRVVLQDYITPHQDFPADGSLRPVQVAGRYDPEHQVLVAGRVLDGKDGWWVVTPLVADGSGARIAVVRGFVSTPSAPAPTIGTDSVTVEGELAPGESPADTTYPAGQVGSVNLAIFANQWGGQIYNAFIFATSEQPTATAAPIQTFPPPEPASGGLQIRNLGYAIQWWLFAGFAVYMWWRMVRDDYRDEQALSSVADNVPDPEERNASV